MTSRGVRLPILTLLLVTGCDRGPTEEPAAPAEPVALPAKSIRLRDATEGSGIDVVTTSGGTPSREILEVNGSGLALIDFDDDEDLDLLVVNGATMEAPQQGPGWRLYRNDGELRFTDVSSSALPVVAQWGMGAAVGDVDGDGHDDLYVACYGPNVLLRNTRDGRFEDVTAAAGVGDENWGTSCAFGDVDGDGDLDLYVVNYLDFDPARPPPRARHKGVEVMNGPHNLRPQRDVLYENLGDGTFRDVTDAAGCLAPNAAFGLNVIMLDIDDDGHQDILVGNDSMANFLFHNLGAESGDATGTARFEEIGLMSGLASNGDGANQATMGIAVGDVDGNGRPDLFSTNFANDSNTLHLNVDGLWFDDRTGQYGLGLVSRPYLGWACAFVDLDHDGDQDLVSFNGHVYPEATVESMDSAYAQPPLLFERDDRRFRVVRGEEAGAWLDDPHRDRAAVFADLDSDGDVDVVVSELNGPVRLLENEAADDRADWLVVRLADTRPGVANRRGLGSRVRLEVGDESYTRWIHSGGGFQSAGPAEAHFGVPGTAKGAVTVTWPDGHEQRVEVALGRRVTVAR